LNPDVAEAVDRLAAEGVLPAGALPRLGRIARGGLLSVRPELRVLLYAGVTLVAAGTAEFVRENYRRIGPVAITFAISLAAAGAFAYVFRRARPFSRDAVPSPTLAFDYALVLGVLLFGSDLAYVETQFRLLGPNWSGHLLLFSLVALAAAYRFDSAATLSLALSAFAAWRGVAVRDPFAALFGSRTALVRANAIACGLLFLAGAAISARRRFKAHFEPVWGNLGLLLLFGGLLSGALGPGPWLVWDALLLAAAVSVLFFAIRAGRELYAAAAIVALYLGAMKIVLHPIRGDVALFTVVSLSASAALVALLHLHKRMKDRRAR
jgi:hypothetical protein